MLADRFVHCMAAIESVALSTNAPALSAPLRRRARRPTVRLRSGFDFDNTHSNVHLIMCTLVAKYMINAGQAILSFADLRSHRTLTSCVSYVLHCSSGNVVSVSAMTVESV